MFKSKNQNNKERNDLHSNIDGYPSTTVFNHSNGYYVVSEK